MSLDERPRGSTRTTPKVHYNSLPRTSIEGALAGFVIIFLSFATAYANYAVFVHAGPALPATQYMAWLADRDLLGTVDTSTFELGGVHRWAEYSSGVALPAMLVVLSWLLLLFPTGRLPSRNWLVAGLGALIGSVLITLWWTTEPGPLFFYPSIDNPFGIEDHTGHVVEGWGRLGWFVGWISLVVSGLSCADRWIETQGEERQQMKWFIYSLFLLVFAYVLMPQVLFLPALALLPISVGVAILKYHLYDIDLLINRTLVYGALTATLVALYVGSIAVLQGLLGALIGQESQLGIVAFTLAVAALFNPLRQRIQSFIDRSFYRSKYDARKTLESFSSMLRDETDLESLSDDLVGVVKETMQPAHASLWLRPDSNSGGEQADQ